MDNKYKTKRIYEKYFKIVLKIQKHDDNINSTKGTEDKPPI